MSNNEEVNILINKAYNIEEGNQVEPDIKIENINEHNLNKQNENIHSKEDSEVLLNELTHLVSKLKQIKKRFKDQSRLFCCGFFSVCMVILLIVFYIFDVLKYEASCKKTRKFLLEICDAPSIGFWPRFFFMSSVIILLVFGLYCTGPTVIIFEPTTNKLTINKKKLFCLPSICEYPLEQLSHACIESDASDATPNLSTFYFYSVTLVFSNEKEKVVNLGLGRDCFFLQKKIELVNSINKYLKAIKNSY